MSNRTALIAGAATVVLALLILTNFGRNLPFGDGTSRDPSLPPIERPERPDRRLLKRFADASLPEILAEMRADLDPVPAAVPPPLLAALPDAPYPFSGAPACDPEALRQAAASFPTPDDTGEPDGEGSSDPESADPSADSTPAVRWRNHLAAAGSGAPNAREVGRFPPETLPGYPGTEPTHAPVRLESQSTDLRAPIALAAIDGEPGLDIVSHGGERFFRLDTSGGQLVALESRAETAGADLVLPADYDGDGDDDLFLVRGRGLPDSLLRNEGNGILEDVTIGAGLLAFGDTTSACWIDCDADGWLDLVVGYRDRPLELYRQEPGGTFVPFAWESGLWVPGDVVRIVAAECNDQPTPEFHVAVDGGPDLFFSRASAGGTLRFADVRTQAGVPSSDAGAVVHFFDFDNDGDEDLLWGEPGLAGDESQARALFPSLTEHPFLRLLLNDGAAKFSDATRASGLAGAGAVRSLATIDLDNDGFEDVIAGTAGLALNRVYWNRMGTGLRDITVSAGFGWLHPSPARPPAGPETRCRREGRRLDPPSHSTDHHHRKRGDHRTRKSGYDRKRAGLPTGPAGTGSRGKGPGAQSRSRSRPSVPGASQTARAGTNRHGWVKFLHFQRGSPTTPYKPGRHDHPCVARRRTSP